MEARRFALTTLLASTLALGCSSSTENPQAAGARGPQHCDIVVAKLQPGQTTSDVISRDCGDNEDDSNTFAAASGKRALIMTWYEDAGYGGGSQKIYGDDGPCDDAGYGIPNVGVYDDITWPFGGWNDTISSFKTWNYCNHAAAYEHENYGGRCDDWYDPGAAGLGVKYVGDKMNPMITSFYVKRGPDDKLCR